MSEDNNGDEVQPSDPQYVHSDHAATALRALVDQEKAARSAQEQAKAATYETQEALRMREMAKREPLRFLREQGVTRDDLQERLETQGRPDPTPQLRSEMADLRQQLEAQKREAHEVKMAAAVREAKSGVEQYVQGTEEFPLVREAGATDMVWQLMNTRHQATGEVISESQACSEVEAYLSGLVKKLAAADSTRTKLRDELRDVLPAQAPTPGPSGTTLTNRHAADATQRPTITDPNLNRESSLLDAARLLTWDG